MVVVMGGSDGKLTSTHHSSHAVSELAKDILVQQSFHSHVMPCSQAASSKAKTAFKDPMLLVQPKSRIACVGFDGTCTILCGEAEVFSVETSLAQKGFGILLAMSEYIPRH